MALLKDLKLMFKTNDLIDCEIRWFSNQDGWSIWFNSIRTGDWIPLETQKSKSGAENYIRIFKTADAAITEIIKIGFRVEKLKVKE